MSTNLKVDFRQVFAPEAGRGGARRCMSPGGAHTHRAPLLHHAGVFVTLPWEGGCSFAVGRSSLRLSPLLAHGHTGRAMAGGCGASGRVARQMALQAASTMGLDHVR